MNDFFSDYDSFDKMVPDAFQTNHWFMAILWGLLAVAFAVSLFRVIELGTIFPMPRKRPPLPPKGTIARSVREVTDSMSSLVPESSLTELRMKWTWRFVIAVAASFLVGNWLSDWTVFVDHNW